MQNIRRTQYHLYRSATEKIGDTGLPFAITLLGLLAVGVLFWKTRDVGWRPHYVMIGAMWVIGVVGAWHGYLSTPHTIIFTDTGQIEFLSIARNRRIVATEIVSIGPGRRAGSLVVKTHNIEIKIPNKFNDFHDFINKVKAVNPGAKIWGC